MGKTSQGVYFLFRFCSKVSKNLHEIGIKKVPHTVVPKIFTYINKLIKLIYKSFTSLRNELREKSFP